MAKRKNARQGQAELPAGYTKIEERKPKKGRSHVATYASDKKSGGYLIRVAGPHAGKFAWREIPVELKDGTEHVEKLQRLVWSGVDKETDKPVALYKFEAKPREEVAAEKAVKF